MALPGFDLTFHLGDAIVGAIGVALAWGMRQIYALLRYHLGRVPQIEEVVDQHSSILVKFAGKNTKFRKLSRDDGRPDYIEGS